MYRPPMYPIANEVTTRAEELKRLASIASQKFNQPVIFVFDTKSTWTNHAEALAEATGYPKEVFLPNQYERFTTGYCSWLLCEYAALNFPLMAEEILENCQPGRVRILSFFETASGETLSSGDILMEHSLLS